MDPTEFLRSAMPLCATLDITASELSPERVVLALGWRPELCTSNGLLHGGAVMALADAAGGACAYSNLPDGAVGTSTIESKTNFLGAVREGNTVTATATPLHVGRTTIVVETELRTDDGKLVGKTTQTQTVLSS
ncbi:MAG: aromatic compound degradation protein PaaI [Acidimicrobiaceae bacterium]|nr:aromatic compound degradation protein PaaI [Acidimicrobiaceae bacterium]